MRFSRHTVSGQAAMEYILVCLPLVLVLIFQCAEIVGVIPTESENGKGSVEFEQTQTGTVKGKYIDSDSSGKHYYVTVKNNGYEADHEASLAEYNAARGGADFPIVLTESDSVKSDEAQEEAETADAAKSQAAEQRQRQSMWWWLMNHQMLMNMSSSAD